MLTAESDANIHELLSLCSLPSTRDAEVESHASCFLVTGQEAPETTKRMRDDLFKKTMSGDGISGRKPYGMFTRMFHIIGMKRTGLSAL